QGQKVGVININSVPPGAKIFLNDKDTNLVTPASLPNEELNFSQKITLKDEKHQEWTRLVTLISPQPLPSEATLDPLPTGTLEVNSQPPGAKVFLDGKDMGGVPPHKITQLELNKTYKVKLELADHLPTEDAVSVYSI